MKTVDRFIQITVIVLTIVFTVLKLTGTLTWPWWVVFSPLWGYLGAGLVFFLLFGVLIVALAAAGRIDTKAFIKK